MKRHAWIVLPLIVVIASCKKDNKNDTAQKPPVYDVPTSYNFSNVNDSNSVKVLLMIDQIGAKINSANAIPNNAVSAQLLKDMFNNVNGYFNDSSLKLNGSGVKLADYCSAQAKTDILNYFDSIGV